MKFVVTSLQKDGVKGNKIALNFRFENRIHRTGRHIS